MAQKATRIYANHAIPLECDIYAEDNYPPDNPVLLYFHPGGLVAWGRDCVAPWVVQMCIQRKWPLISPSYRLLPQTGANGLLEDVTAAYDFAQNWNATKDARRRVIVGGASGGFFAAALIAHHLEPKPLALLSIEGINSFRHAFFNSSTLLTPEPITESDVVEVIAGPISIDVTPAQMVFRAEKLSPDGSKNESYVADPEALASLPGPSNPSRGMLYDYYTYINGWNELVGPIDPGYEWARETVTSKERLAKWPPTVILHGDNDDDVALAVSENMRDCLGSGKVSLFIAVGQPHLFELDNFIEDKAPGMDTVRAAVARLDEIVG